MMEDISKIYVFLQIWIICTRIFDTYARLTVKRGDSYIANATFLVQDQTLVQQCAQLCMTFPICLSVTLSLHSLQCRLHAVIEEQYPELMAHLAGGNFIYIEKRDFEKDFPKHTPPDSCGIDMRYIKNLNRCIPHDFGPLSNVATGQVTNISSTMIYQGKPFRSEYAVDGNWGGHALTDKCAHSDEEQSPWWTVDLKYPYLIYSVDIMNRADYRGDRLRNIKVLVGYELSSLTLCGTFDGPGDNGQHVKIPCGTPVVGKLVKILLDAYEYLVVCEVGVFANSLLL